MAAITKPTVLFIHGSWHSPNHFQPIRDLFSSDGYPTERPRQPTFDAKPAPPVISLADDVKVVQEVLTRLVEQEGKEVVVVMHSYGGVVGSESVHEKYGKKARDSQGVPGGVIELLYLCAFILPIGAPLASALGGGLPPFIKAEANGLCTMDEPERRFYNDLSKEEQDLWTSELAPSPAIAQMTAVTYAAYQHHPVTYLFCMNDQALQPEIQQMMVKGMCVDVKVESCDSGHSPFLSQPETVLQLVKKIAA